MEIFPAIDLLGAKAVRLQRGDYNRVTVYSENPSELARKFEARGAEYLHVVDLDGARDGTTPNIDVIKAIVRDTSLRVEVGGGIRSAQTLKTYMDAGVYRAVIGTAAVTDPEFLRLAVKEYGERIAVGADISEGRVAIKGWRELSALSCFDFFAELEKTGVRTVICTDISKDGMLGGTNTELYRELLGRFSLDITASGGITTTDDVKKLSDMGMYGAILGKALYAGTIKLEDALAVCKGSKK